MATHGAYRYTGTLSEVFRGRRPLSTSDIDYNSHSVSVTVMVIITERDNTHTIVS